MNLPTKLVICGAGCFSLLLLFLVAKAMEGPLPYVLTAIVCTAFVVGVLVINAKKDEG